jgi:tRNA(Ile)-lysidine synthase TilS/MesJ
MQVCKKCVLPGTYPGIEFDDDGVCNYCSEYSNQEVSETDACFTNEEDIKKCLEKYKNLGRKYDVLVPLSGGVDSCFTLITIVERYGLKPLVFHSDHGFDDEVAFSNVEKLCRVLDLDLLIWKNEWTYMRKLFKYFNESDEHEVSPCHACGNILYLNGLELADHFNIPLVINGYSKGQAAMMHDKEKARHWYSIMINVILETGDRDFLNKFTEKWKLLDKQVIYRDKQDLQKPVNPNRILFIPLFVFKFYKTDKETLKKICKERFDWQPIKVSYPARTTNCEMIWLNSYMDMKKRGYTHYHDEYSTIIRAGEMTREQALKDLELHPPKGLLERLAKEIDLQLPPA